MTASTATARPGRPVLPVWAPPVPPGRALVVVAHPDDEVLALGPVVTTLDAAGWVLDLLVLTDGEAAYPALDAAGRARLAAVRRDELDAAWAALLPGAGHRGGRVLRAGLPDARLPDVAAAVRGAVDAAAAASPPDLVVGLWPHDPHHDHAGAALAAVALAARLAVPSVQAPLWARVWWDDDDARLPRATASRVPVAGPAAGRLAAALAAHASQVQGFEGHGPLLGPDDLAALAGDGLVVTA